MHDYAVTILKLSDNVAYNFITVARKAAQVPELKKIIQSGNLGVSKARKIVSVLTKENQNQWLQMAVDLPQKKLEQQVAKAFPIEAVPERIKFVSETRLSLQLGVSEGFNEKLRRAQDIECQKRRSSASFKEALEAALDLYLKSQDPLQKAEKLKDRKNLSVLRRVSLRDRGQCTHIGTDGKRCAQSRWTESHHIIPRSKGGADTLENLTTLCAGHHRLIHFRH